MNLDELRTVQSKERQKDSLQHLRPSFYQEVGEYIEELKTEREEIAERADDPFSSPEVGRLTDEIETAKDVVEAIYERRMGKLVKQASLSAAGMPADDEGLTSEEADLFDDLVDRIQSNKGRVLDVLEGEIPDDSGATGDSQRADVDGSKSAQAGSDAPPAPPEEPPAPPEEGPADGPESTAEGVSAADAMGGGPPGGDESEARPSPDRPAASESGPNADPAPTPSERPDEGATESVEDGTDGDADGDDGVAGGDEDVDRVTVRITRDVGPILGIDDREYTLTADDVVTLPEQNADPLVERDAAEPLE